MQHGDCCDQPVFSRELMCFYCVHGGVMGIYCQKCHFIVKQFELKEILSAIKQRETKHSQNYKATLGGNVPFH